MNKQIKKYWEDKGYEIFSQENLIPRVNITGTPIFYFKQNGHKIFIAAKWNNNQEFTYWCYPNWLSEIEMIKLISYV